MSPPPHAADSPDAVHSHCGDPLADADCAEAVAAIYTFLDGELDETVVVQIEAHLQRCSPCLDAFDFEAELRRVIARRCVESIPDESRVRLKQMLSDLSSGPGVPAAPEPS